MPVATAVVKMRVGSYEDWKPVFDSPSSGVGDETESVQY
jgi:hypothetical protein